MNLKIRVIRLLMFLPLAFLYQNAYGQESCDSIGTNISLNEVEIDAQLQRTDSRTTTYFPTKRQKQAAQNAIQLLNFISIPQIRINPQNESVTSNLGSEIEIYINYNLATNDDLKGINPTDIKKVEYIEAPIDPRFRNANVVINIITAQYEWGGYTKIMPEIQQGTFTAPNLQIFSKFAFKKMVYDFSGNVGSNHDHSLGFDQICEYKVFNSIEEPTFILENKKVSEGRYHSRSERLNFRAVYSTDRSQIHNTLTFSANQTPTAESIYDIQYESPINLSGEQITQKESHSTTIGWRGDYFWILPNEWNLFFAGEATYSHSNRSSIQLFDSEIVINNPTIEEITKYGFYIGSQKLINQKHSLTPYVTFNTDYNKVKYTAEPRSLMRYREVESSASLNYEFHASKWLLGIEASWHAVWTAVNSNKYEISSQPDITVNFNYTHSEKQQLFIKGSYSINSPSSSLRNPTLSHIDLLLWTVGNPKLSPSPKLNLGAGYTWLPSNKWQFSINGSFERNWKNFFTNYLPIGPDNTILAQKVNQGQFDNGLISANGTFKLLNNSLSIQFSPMLTYNSLSGENRSSLVTFAYWLNLNYFIGRCYINPYYISASKRINSLNGQEQRDKSNYGIYLGWNKNNLNIALNVRNFARWNNKDTSYILKTPFFNRIYQSRLGYNHASISLSVTYTFNYGKRIMAENENFESVKTSSAILEE